MAKRRGLYVFKRKLSPMYNNNYKTKFTKKILVVLMNHELVLVETIALVAVTICLPKPETIHYYGLYLPPRWFLIAIDFITVCNKIIQTLLSQPFKFCHFVNKVFGKVTSV